MLDLKVIAGNFDNFRKHYQHLTFEQRRQIYAMWHKQYPVQRWWAQSGFHHLLNEAIKTFELSKVVELGGHDGELAQTLLKKHSQLTWLNLEILQFPPLRAHRYQFYLLQNQLWLINLDLRNYDLFVASDVIEHFSAEELTDLIKYLAKQRIPYLALASPLSEEGQSWKGYNGAHILPWGSNQVKQALEPYYELLLEKKHWQSLWKCRN